MSARNNILAKLKSQVEGANYDLLPEESAYHYPEQSKAEMVEQFVSNLTANHAEIIDTSVDELGKEIHQALAKRGIKKLLHGSNEQYDHALAEIAEEGTDLVCYDFELTGDNKNYLFNDIEAGISGSVACIAQTGTIVIWPTKAEPRTLSLVPPLHIVVVDANSMYQTFGQIMAEQGWKDKLPTNIVLASGPSKTADIQQTLAYGAHGPKELVVLMLNS